MIKIKLNSHPAVPPVASHVLGEAPEKPKGASGSARSTLHRERSSEPIKGRPAVFSCNPNLNQLMEACSSMNCTHVREGGHARAALYKSGPTLTLQHVARTRHCGVSRVSAIVTKGPADPAVAPPNSRLLRISQAAQYLSVTNWFMETLLREKNIPSMFLGKRKVVDVRDIDAWSDRQKQKAVAP